MNIIYQNNMLPKANPELWEYLSKSGFTDGKPAGHQFSLRMKDGGYGKFFNAKYFTLILGSTMWKNAIVFVKLGWSGKYKIKGTETLPFMENVDGYFLDYGVDDRKLKLYSNFYREFFTGIVRSFDNNIRTNFAGDRFFANLDGLRSRFNAIAERLCKKYHVPR